MTAMDVGLYVEASMLLAEFAWRVDNGEGHTVAELFLDDAAIDTPHFRLDGRAAIHDWFSARAPKDGPRLSRHHATNLRIRTLDSERIEILANALTFVGVAPAPGQGASVAVGVSRDVVRRTPDGLRFEARALQVVMEARLAAPEPHG